MEIFDSNDADIESKYKIIKKIGQGSYGDVKLAIDLRHGRKVAIKTIKIMSKNKQIPKAIFREIESLKQLNGNIHIMKLYDTYCEAACVCLVLEYLPTDLSEVINQTNQHLPTGMIKSYAYSMLSAINYCHSKFIIHRDIKPSSESFI